MIKKITVAGMTVIWIVGFLLLRDSTYAGPDYWLGFVFGLVGFAVAAGSMLLPQKGNQSTTETGYIGGYYTAVFIAVMLLLNLVFAFQQSDRLMPLFVLANLVAILVYGVNLFGAAQHFQRVKELTEYVPEKVKNTADISQELSVLLSMAKDADVRQELLKFKENVVYSNNVSQKFSEGMEELLLEKLYTIQEALQNGTDTETVMVKIRDAADTWNIRNSRINMR